MSGEVLPPVARPIDRRFATSVEWPTDAAGDGRYYCIGRLGTTMSSEGDLIEVGDVTEIVVTDDMPGPHCFLERVRVFVGDLCIAEAPLFQVAFISYGEQQCQN